MPDSTTFYELRNLVWADKVAAKKRFAANPNLRHIRNGIGETLLHWFAVENCQEEIAWLLERGASVNAVNDFGSSPLLKAVELGYTELALFLLDKGADPRLADSVDETALSAALDRDNTTLIPYLEAALREWEYRPKTKTTSTVEERQLLDAWLKKSSRKSRR